MVFRLPRALNRLWGTLSEVANNGCVARTATSICSRRRTRSSRSLISINLTTRGERHLPGHSGESGFSPNLGCREAEDELGKPA